MLMFKPSTLFAFFSFLKHLRSRGNWKNIDNCIPDIVRCMAFSYSFSTILCACTWRVNRSAPNWWKLKSEQSAPATCIELVSDETFWILINAQKDANIRIKKTRIRKRNYLVSLGDLVFRFLFAFFKDFESALIFIFFFSIEYWKGTETNLNLNVKRS